MLYEKISCWLELEFIHQFKLKKKIITAYKIFLNSDFDLGVIDDV